MEPCRFRVGPEPSSESGSGSLGDRSRSILARRVAVDAWCESCYKMWSLYPGDKESFMGTEDPRKVNPSKEEPGPGKADSPELPELPDDDLKAVTGGLQSTPGAATTSEVCISQL